ncbi:MAG: S1 family peptidase [Bifidobacteriaceae bacterium]|jgi:hypothetical protein|nr:S1 family peptidase [Bifidobacteriaceae bacterium]
MFRSSGLISLAITVALTSPTAIPTAIPDPIPDPGIDGGIDGGIGGANPIPTSTGPAVLPLTGAKLPDGLRTALSRDLGASPAEFLASGNLAVQGAALAHRLAGLGIRHEDVDVDGGAIHVRVTGSAAAQAVAAAGAIPVLTTPSAAASLAPEAAPPSPTTAPTTAPTVRPLAAEAGGAPEAGSKYRTDRWNACTIGFWGRDPKGKAIALTAGHCADGAATAIELRVPSTPWKGFSGDAGVIGAFGPYRYGGGYDLAVIRADSKLGPAAPTLKAWSADGAIAVAGAVEPVLGAKVCKSGGRTGWTCGVITALARDFVLAAPGLPHVSGFSTSLCSGSGDSGSPVLSGAYAVGIVSFGSFDIRTGDSAKACALDQQISRLLAAQGSDTAGREAVRRAVQEDVHSLILTGVQPVAGEGPGAATLFGADFRLLTADAAAKANAGSAKATHRAHAIPRPTVTRVAAKRGKTVVKGRVKLGGAKASHYRVRLRVGKTAANARVNQSGGFRVAVKAAAHPVSGWIRTVDRHRPALRSAAVKLKSAGATKH